jgi:hypothetical protein
MNSKLVSILSSLCIVCALIISGEWLYAVRAQKHALAPATSTETKISHDEMPRIDLTGQSEESYQDLVAKPLFIKGRKPVDEPKPEEVQASNVAKAFDWQLNGVYSTKKGLSALFSRSTSKVPKDNYRRIGAGADLDGWKLTEVHKDRAILKQGDQQKELLLRKPKLKVLPNKERVPPAPNIHQPVESIAPPENGLAPPEDRLPPPEDGLPPPEDGMAPPEDGLPPPEDGAEPEPNLPPAEGEFENNNEQF